MDAVKCRSSIVSRIIITLLCVACSKAGNNMDSAIHFPVLATSSGHLSAVGESQQGGDEPGVMRVRSLEVVNEHGVQVAGLGSDQYGRADLFLLDRKGNRVVTAAPHDGHNRSGAFVLLQGTDGSSVSASVGASNSSAALRISGPGGTERFVLLAHEDESELRMMDSRGNPRLIAEMENISGRESIYPSGDGGSRLAERLVVRLSRAGAEFSSGMGDSPLELWLDEDGSIRLYCGTPNHENGVVLFVDVNGRVRLEDLANGMPIFLGGVPESK